MAASEEMLMYDRRYHVQAEEEFDIHEAVTTGVCEQHHSYITHHCCLAGFTAGVFIIGTFMYLGSLACSWWLVFMPVLYAVVFCASVHLASIYTCLYCVAFVLILGAWLSMTLREQRASFCEKVIQHIFSIS